MQPAERIYRRTDAGHQQVGLLESVPQAGADDLDFSGNFNRAALAAAHNARG